MHKLESINAFVLEFVADALNIDISKLKLESEFENIKLDSVIFIKLIVECEAKFEVEFEDEKLFVEEFTDISSFTNYIYELLKSSDDTVKEE